jgi:2-methylcitrate dehydratase PrpD
VACKIAESIHADHFTGGRGFHTSGTIGIFGAAAAAAKLLRLSADRTNSALGIAASMSSGIGANHGTMVKPLQMGRAAENGVTAARLASFGMQANPVALEGPRGFFHCFGGGFHPDRISGKLGAPYSMLEPGVSIKPYPCGVVGHPGMDAMGALVRRHNISPQDVAHVVVATGSSVIPPKGPLRYLKAATALEGKFCLPFQIAAMLLRQKAGLMEFTDDFVQQPDTQEMMDRIETVADPEIAALGHDKLIFDVTVTLKNGKTFKLFWDKPYRGGPLNPLTDDELAAKFVDASQHVIGSTTQKELLDLLNSLEQLDSLSPLLALAAVSSRQGP